MVKNVNRYTSNEFHDWQRENLPGRFVIQDIDTWTIVVSDSEKDYAPLFMVELKRSYIGVNSWKPFEADKPNYLALFKLSEKSKLDLLVIYFKKGQTIMDETKIAIFKILNVNDSMNWITYKKKIITAMEFKNGFPDILTTGFP